MVAVTAAYSQGGKFGSNISPIGSWTLDFALVNLEKKIAEGGGGAVYKATYVVCLNESSLEDHHTNQLNAGTLTKMWL